MLEKFMAPIWLKPELAHANRREVLKLYRDLLRALSHGPGGIGIAVREARMKDVRLFFDLGSQQASVSNIRQLMDTGKHVLTQLRKGYLPRRIITE